MRLGAYENGHRNWWRFVWFMDWQTHCCYLVCCRPWPELSKIFSFFLPRYQLLGEYWFADFNKWRPLSYWRVAFLPSTWSRQAKRGRREYRVEQHARLQLEEVRDIHRQFRAVTKRLLQCEYWLFPVWAGECQWQRETTSGIARNVQDTEKRESIEWETGEDEGRRCRAWQDWNKNEMFRDGDISRATPTSNLCHRIIPFLEAQEAST